MWISMFANDLLPRLPVLAVSRISPALHRAATIAAGYEFQTNERNGVAYRV